jgi:hypothetical protein
MKTYGQGSEVHFVGLGLVAFGGFFLHKVITDPYPLPFLTRLSFILFVSAYTIGVLYLYLATSLNRYEVTDEGLRVKRCFLFRSTFHPWPQITKITLYGPIKTVAIRAHNGLVFFSSTDCFPDLGTFLIAIHQKSSCSYSPNLTKLLQSDTPPA